MYRYSHRKEERTRKEIALDSQRAFDPREWERQQKRQRTAILCAALKAAARHPNPTFRLRFSPESSPGQHCTIQSTMLKGGVSPLQPEWDPAAIERDVHTALLLRPTPGGAL